MNQHPQSQELWKQLRNNKCRECGLHEEADTICLLGDGPVPCDAMIIGEAPGYREDELGIPFAGKSGLLLRKTLKEIGLDPRKIYITNTVACRPPANRQPKTKEAKTCGNLYLTKQIDIVKPRVILLLGNTAVAFVKGKKAAVTKLEGTTFKYGVNSNTLPLFPFHDITCVPSRHPSSVARLEDDPKEYPFVFQKFKEQLLLFKRTLYPPKDDTMKFYPQPELGKFEKDKGIYQDIETNGLNPFREDSVIHSISLAQYPSTVYCFATKKEQDFWFRQMLTHYRISAHRAMFEAMWYRWKFGVTPRIYHDTKMCAHLRDENDLSGLKYQAIKHLGVEPWSEEQDWTDPDFATLLPYNARDSRYGLRLYREHDLPFLKKNPKIAKLLRHIIYPAMEVFTEIVCNGYHINEKEAKKKLKHCQVEKKKLNDELNKIAGKEVNPGSPPQMSRLFYTQLRLKCPVTTRGGANSTSEAALIRLRGQHKATDLLWDWRGWQKYETTYLVPWLRQGPDLHALYDFTGTLTGRLSSSMVKNRRGEKKTGAVIHQCPRNPFIRNLISPRGYRPTFDIQTGKWGPPAHVTPRSEDWCIVAADLSQIELRLVAHYANEPTMIHIFNQDRHSPEGDIHLATAMDVLHAAKEAIDKETRKKAKAVNFGFVYGMMAKKFVAYALEKFDLRLSRQDGKEYRAGFFAKYDRLLPWHKEVEEIVTRQGYIDSEFGRRRHLPGALKREPEECPENGWNCGEKSCFHCGGTGYISGTFEDDNDDHAKWIRMEEIRQAINSPIQGMASDLLLFIIALIASYSLKWRFKIDRERCFGIGSAHDSMLFECHKSYVGEFKAGIDDTVDSLPILLRRYFGIELRAPVAMDVSAYEDCWEGKEMKV